MDKLLSECSIEELEKRIEHLKEQQSHIDLQNAKKKADKITELIKEILSMGFNIEVCSYSEGYSDVAGIKYDELDKCFYVDNK